MADRRSRKDVLNSMQEMHPRSNLLSDFILGWQDGLVNVLGIVLGVSAATSNFKLLLVAALAALGAESLSMGAVAYTSTLARRKQYQKAIAEEQREMKEIPHMEREEVRAIFKSWGYKGRELDDLVKKICSKPKAWLELMLAFELKLAPVEEMQPFRSFLTVFGSTVFGSVIPLIPFFFLSTNLVQGAIVSVVISGIVLFIVGVYTAKTTVGSLWRNGLQMLVIGLAAGLAGYLIGYFVGATPI
jgi:VIT1/CCC1 family predicted Fe2+/Mn2+ transporter